MKRRLWQGIATLFLVAFLGVGYYYSERINVPDFISLVKHNKLTVLITTVRLWYAAGEKQTCMRLLNTLKKMGCCPVIVEGSHIPWFMSMFKYDFALNTRDNFEPNPDCYNFLIVHITNQEIAKEHDAILAVVPRECLKKEANGKPVLDFYLTEQATEFLNSPKTKLFYCNNGWDSYRKKHCEKLYKLLDKTDYFEAYGRPVFWENLNLKSYHGVISTQENAFLHAMQKAGVSLILHSREHFSKNITTARIFESLAASNVIICDKLPFVIENFGDTILYFDRDASPEEMFRQIDNHMQWILSHQKEAIEMARKAHKIFLEKFTLEKQLQNVIDFYEKHKEKKR